MKPVWVHRASRPTRRRGLSLVVGLAVLGAGCGASKPSSGGPPARLVEVEGDQRGAAPFTVTTTAVSTIEPENRVAVAAQEEA